MDSLDQVIKDMEDDYTDLSNINPNSKNQFATTAKYASLIALNKYLARLKALRELTDKQEENGN